MTKSGTGVGVRVAVGIGVGVRVGVEVGVVVGVRVGVGVGGNKLEAAAQASSTGKTRRKIIQGANRFIFMFNYRLSLAEDYNHDAATGDLWARSITELQ
jgi:hypothetical protein